MAGLAPGDGLQQSLAGRGGGTRGFSTSVCQWDVSRLPSPAAGAPLRSQAWEHTVLGAGPLLRGKGAPAQGLHRTQSHTGRAGGLWDGMGWGGGGGGSGRGYTLHGLPAPHEGEPIAQTHPNVPLSHILLLGGFILNNHFILTKKAPPCRRVLGGQCWQKLHLVIWLRSVHQPRMLSWVGAPGRHH